MMIADIDEYRGRFGVEPICRVLGVSLEGGFITSCGYRLAKSRPASARSIRDRILAEELGEIHAHNFGVYGIRKMWHAARRAGWDIGRDQVARLMKIAGISGIHRGRTPVTTRQSQAADLRPDLVHSGLYLVVKISHACPAGSAVAVFSSNHGVCQGSIFGAVGVDLAPSFSLTLRCTAS